MNLHEILTTLPKLAREVSAEDVPTFVGVLELAKLEAVRRAHATETTRGTANVSVEDAAKRLGISASYIYKNARALPFVVRIGRRLLCDAAALEKWNRKRSVA